MEEHDQLLIVVVFSIVGLISTLFFVCLIVWWTCRRLSSNGQLDSSQTDRTTRPTIRQRRRNKRRFNTNDSSISLSFNPPHLLNQNVRNLDRLLRKDSPDPNWCHPNLRAKPIYTSTSPLQCYPQTPTPQLNNLRFHLLNELNDAICSKSINPLKYSQSCRQRNDPLPFDYYRTLTSSTITRTSSSNETLFDSLPDSTFNYSNVTLMRKAHLAQLRDDTAIYY